MPDLNELPEDVRTIIAEWESALGDISSRLLEEPERLQDAPYNESHERLHEAERAFQQALSEFMPRFLANDAFVIFPMGIDAWFETSARAELALHVAHKQWVRAAWTCGDDLDNQALFAAYLKKAGPRGRWILAQNRLEDMASDISTRLERGFERAVDRALHALSDDAE